MRIKVVGCGTLWRENRPSTVSRFTKRLLFLCKGISVTLYMCFRLILWRRCHEYLRLVDRLSAFRQNSIRRIMIVYFTPQQHRFNDSSFRWRCISKWDFWSGSGSVLFNSMNDRGSVDHFSLVNNRTGPHHCNWLRSRVRNILDNGLRMWLLRHLANDGGRGLNKNCMNFLDILLLIFALTVTVHLLAFFLQSGWALLSTILSVGMMLVLDEVHPGGIVKYILGGVLFPF